MFNQPFGGLKVVVSEHAVKDGGRVKTYPRRKAKSAAHWRRMDKKWRKRYGFRREPCMYRMGNTVIAHPSLYAQLRASLGE
jgi:hypothetical protein